jgi:Mn2+/Fe2+ NRAMP family transporter
MSATAPAPDPSSLTVGIEEPPTTFRDALRRIGPGLILAGAIVGTGELIATTNLGAKAGYALLWLVILSCFIKVFVQIELGRYALSSGEGTFRAFSRLPGPGLLLVWWCVAMIAVTQMQIGAMIAGVAQAIELATPGLAARLAGPLSSVSPTLADALAARPELPWAVVTTVVTIGLLATGSYRLVERGTTLLVVTFTLMTVVCVALLPVEHRITAQDLGAGLAFRIPVGATVAAFTMFGITGVGASELLAYPYWCIEKGYGRFVGPRDESPGWAERARGWLRVMRLDAWVSMIIYTIATLSFYILGAAVLHGRTKGDGLPASQMIPTLAGMYEPTLGPRAATAFIVVGSFSVLYSTLFAATAGNSRILTDFLRVNRFIDPDSEAVRLWWVRFFCTLLPSIGFVLYLTYRNPVLMVTFGGVMQGLTLPLIAAAAVFLRYRRTDRRITPGMIWDLFLIASMVGLMLAAAFSLWNGYTELRKLLV